MLGLAQHKLCPTFKNGMDLLTVLCKQPATQGWPDIEHCGRHFWVMLLLCITDWYCCNVEELQTVSQVARVQCSVSCTDLHSRGIFNTIVITGLPDKQSVAEF
ncbi:TPA: hypothetical protein ACH3X1_000146 [Trebouxia sp. C0004]